MDVNIPRKRTMRTGNIAARDPKRIFCPVSREI
jgi:hypothetical protein